MSGINDLSSDSAVYKTLLESTQAIPWKIDWSTMSFAYIGPQIEPLLGWSQESWVTAEDWATRIHPDDRDYVVNFCIAQSQAGVDHEADYRALTKDNGYVWIRDVVHVVRNDSGEVESLIGFMFDISERKKTEEKLIALQKELEALSFKDGLTGIANRRQFDVSLEREWAGARNGGLPLSLILIDVDFFKQYNDLYGHIQGDKCLIDIAQTLSLAAIGPRDVVARFGGEEFVLMLPETDAAGARKVAERCHRLIEKLAIPHSQSPHGQNVTVSIGVGTSVPRGDSSPTAFIQAVDRQLYAAKQNGRNRIEYFDERPAQ
ncbi:GGDEF domain-containing protein [Ralstonia soli]|uniref:diguanylate cyclase n=1 Tax=Ralstonia soli TaxID=2953896 RepID=A0ABT1AGD8_9RALS|nr:sensor domain-containing diguanylate cyclase [Ralstonia soli]MCO5397450.1 sensor domain-containing diguanylate cyclase [Ralstonia soli]